MPSYRLNERHPNEERGSNVIVSFIPEDLTDHFGEIIDDTTILNAAYIPERYNSQDAGPASMNAGDPGQFTDNMVARWSESRNEWRPIRGNRDIAKRLQELIQDPAELQLLDYLVRLTRECKKSLKSTGPRYDAPSLPEKRILFLQGGIGTGKSTLLHHFARCVVPQLRAQALVPVDFLPIILDFRDTAPEDAVRAVWERHVQQIVDEIEQFLDDQQIHDWWDSIAAQDLTLGSGRVRPRHKPQDTSTRASQQLIKQSSENTVFLQRACRFLTTFGIPVYVILILDNIDKQELSITNQVAYIHRLTKLLSSVRGGIGVTCLREYTLGNMSHLVDFRAHHFTARQHITTPRIGQILRRRIELCLKKTKNVVRHNIQISESISVTLADMRQILLSVHTALEEDRRSGDVNILKRSPSVTEFLHGCTNSNTRLSLGLVMRGLESWALLVDSAVLYYLHHRDVFRRKQLPLVSFDELLRLCMVGRHQYYDSSECEGIANIFAWGNRATQADNGEFPTLIKHRIMQFFHNFGSGVLLNDVRANFAIFHGIRGRAIDDLLHELILDGFLESQEGTRLGYIKKLYGTRKLRFYLAVLCKSLVYLENIRNDCVIDYNTYPHECRDELSRDILGIFDFIRFVLRQEKMEYAYIKQRSRRSPGIRVSYRRMLPSEPLSLILLRSVSARLNQLDGDVMKLDGFDRKEAVREFCALRSAILRAIEDGNLLCIGGQPKGMHLKL